MYQPNQDHQLNHDAHVEELHLGALSRTTSGYIKRRQQEWNADSEANIININKSPDYSASISSKAPESVTNRCAIECYEITQRLDRSGETVAERASDNHGIIAEQRIHALQNIMQQSDYQYAQDGWGLAL